MFKKYDVILNKEQFYQEAERVLNNVGIFFEQHQLLSQIRFDHIGFKCASAEEFESMRKMFESGSSYIFQSIISNRRIAIIKLSDSIQTTLGFISVLELSDQKPDQSQKSGFDHLEVYPIEGSVEKLVECIQEKGIDIHQEVKPHHTTWDFFVDTFKVRIEPGALIEKIKEEEMV
jgi:predicted metalloenzyme YecM